MFVMNKMSGVVIQFCILSSLLGIQGWPFFQRSSSQALEKTENEEFVNNIMSMNLRKQPEPLDLVIQFVHAYRRYGADTAHTLFKKQYKSHYKSLVSRKISDGIYDAFGINKSSKEIFANSILTDLTDREMQAINSILKTFHWSPSNVATYIGQVGSPNANMQRFVQEWTVAIITGNDVNIEILSKYLQSFQGGFDGKKFRIIANLTVKAGLEPSVFGRVSQALVSSGLSEEYIAKLVVGMASKMKLNPRQQIGYTYQMLQRGYPSVSNVAIHPNDSKSTIVKAINVLLLTHKRHETMSKVSLEKECHWISQETDIVKRQQIIGMMERVLELTRCTWFGRENVNACEPILDTFSRILEGFEIEEIVEMGASRCARLGTFGSADDSKMARIIAAGNDLDMFAVMLSDLPLHPSDVRQMKLSEAHEFLAKKFFEKAKMMKEIAGKNSEGNVLDGGVGLVDLCSNEVFDLNFRRAEKIYHNLEDGNKASFLKGLLYLVTGVAPEAHEEMVIYHLDFVEALHYIVDSACAN